MVESPIINAMLPIFDPTILPKAISGSPCTVAKSETKSSGRIYKSETKSIPKATFVVFNLWVRATTESAVQSALFDKKKILINSTATQSIKSIIKLTELVIENCVYKSHYLILRKLSSLTGGDKKSVTTD